MIFWRFANALQLNGKHSEAYDLSAWGKDNSALKRWLLHLPKPCGVFAASDAVAKSVLAVCRLAGISVPGDVAVIGVDDNKEICENTVPTLTSIHPDFVQGGRFAARLLARMLHGGRGLQKEVVFDASGIVRRGSTRVFRRKDAEVSVALERIWAPGGLQLAAKEVLSGFRASRRSAEIRFRRTTGRSVLQELSAARAEHAKALLADTRLPVSAVAGQCGYSSLAHFRETFRKATGCNPLAWRERSVRGK